MSTLGSLGDTRKTAEASGMFQWFALDAEGTEQIKPNLTAVSYRPNGAAFHDLTEVVLTLTDTERLHTIELRLARRFIEDRRNAIFARDIAKSVLRGAMDPVDQGLVADLINEIEYPRHLDVPVITGPREIPSLPEHPTAGYEVYLGQRGRSEAMLRSVILILENYVRDDAPWFRMSITGYKAP